MKLGKVVRSIHFFYQRITRGWDDSETWSLDQSLADLIAPRLRRFREITIAHPADMSEREWAEQLDKMIAAFEYAASGGQFSDRWDDAEIHQEGLDLFAKHFFGLWW